VTLLTYSGTPKNGKGVGTKTTTAGSYLPGYLEPSERKKERKKEKERKKHREESILDQRPKLAATISCKARVLLTSYTA